MDGDLAPLRDLFALAEKYDAGLIVDEAHATGVMGPNGRGVVAAAGRSECVIATIHTCGKALASMGAFVACSSTVRHYLINRARPFVFSTALPPYIAAQTDEALRIARDLDDRRVHLERLSSYLREKLQHHGFNTGASESHIVPVILGTNRNALRTAERLVASGFGVKPIRPPTVPAGTARLRLSMNARLTTDQLSSFVQVLCNGR
jgi:8-amino-7-oxononanoate synthase